VTVAHCHAWAHVVARERFRPIAAIFCRITGQELSAHDCGLADAVNGLEHTPRTWQALARLAYLRRDLWLSAPISQFPVPEAARIPLGATESPLTCSGSPLDEEVIRTPSDAR